MQVIINIDERLLTALRSRWGLLLLFSTILLVLLVGISYGSDATWDNLNVFNRGTVISSSQVNQNFRALQEKIHDLDTRTATVPVGTIIPWGGLSSSVPDGWMICDGRELGRNNYDILFSVIHTIWGEGDGIRTFNLPDFRGLFLRGSNMGGKNRVTRRSELSSFFDPDADSRIWNNDNPSLPPYKSNREYVGSYQEDAFQGHWHAINYGTRKISSGGGSTFNNPGKKIFSNMVQEAITDGQNGIPRVASETRAMNASVHFIIKVR